MAETEKDGPNTRTNTANDPREAAAEARMNAGSEMLRQLAIAGAALGGRAAIGALRVSVPMLEVYASTTREIEEQQAGKLPAGRLERLGMARGEALVVRRAAGKALLESIEISSLLYPVYDGAPVYRMRGDNEQSNAPQLVHLLALGRAAAAIWARWNASQERPEPEVPEEEFHPASRTVAYVATAPGEYRYLSAPQQPAEIRRYAMRQRSLNMPQQAMLAYSGNPSVLAPASMARAGAPVAVAGAGRAAAARSPSQSAARQHADCGCGCGGSSGGAHDSCGCGCGSGHGRAFSPARYTDDGRCANLLSISCETRWRIRECFKMSFCDLLRCMGNELCDRDETTRPDLGACVEDFICNLLHCLPEAICPPEAAEPCCGPAPADHSCGCSFAVGD
ncbi:hypothetical protein JJJ17_11160 [Paracoccus caeni]|uniref:Uncharacterized protein n=1 Tax=Paracoccus caeni TaxID=657651 RepID=A0A934SCS1_9RHOB|nr:hypothetical protein [Paracoccus caeni]MBK4216485.1 hypothetical protein [Paracoccus caeni]